MRKLGPATSLVLAIALAATPATAVAAGPADGTIGITANIQFSSILGGATSGTAYLEGTVSGGEIGVLRGSADLPLRDQRLAITPVGILALARQESSVRWEQVRCDQFGCFWTYGYSTFERHFAQGPVDVRLGSMRGDGTLALSTTPVCVATCPPPGAYYWLPWPGSGFTTLQNAAVVGSQDAGFVNLYGQAPAIN